MTDIPRTFRRDFPQFVARIEEMGCRVHVSKGKRVNGPCYWLNDEIQLTGYTTKADGSVFTREDGAKHIQSVLDQITEGRAEIAGKSQEDRVQWLVDHIPDMHLRLGNFCSYRHPSGDKITILYHHSPYSAWVKLWDSEKDAAHAENIAFEQIAPSLIQSFCARTTISGRTPRVVT